MGREGDTKEIEDLEEGELGLLEIGQFPTRFASAQVVDGRPINGADMPNSYPYFMVKEGLVYCVTQIGVEVVEQ